MTSHHVRRGATDTSTTIIIIVVAVVVGVILVVGCVGTVLVRITMPALTTARESAHVLRSSAQLAQIDASYRAWLADPTQPEPFSLQVLAEVFISPFGPAPDGGDDYWLLTDRPELEPAVLARLIVGYDRAMYATRPHVAVLFGDGRVEQLEIADFEQRMGSPPNDDLDFDLPDDRSRME